MRVLFTTAAASGHLHPLVPLAQSLQAAGHEVAFASADEVRPTVEGLGFRFFPAGIPVTAAMAELEPLRATAPDADHPLWGGKEMFGRILPGRMVLGLLATVRAWEPDLIVRETTEVAGAIVAEAFGLPHASVEVGAFFSAPFLADLLGDHVNRLRAGLDLPPDPALAMLYRHLHLSFVPPSYQDPAQPLPPTAVALRPEIFDQSGDETLPGWVRGLPERPTVYATLGTVFNGQPDLFRAILAGLADLPLNLILTVGRDGDPAGLGPQPANVRIERYVPQSLLLPLVDAVVCHGGWNTVLGTLRHGRPLVVLPLGAEQPMNAERVARLGAGRVLGEDERSPEAIRAATLAVLNDPSYRTAAHRLRSEMAALPGMDHAVALLEGLAGGSRGPGPGPKLAALAAANGATPSPYSVTGGGIGGLLV